MSTLLPFRTPTHRDPLTAADAVAAVAAEQADVSEADHRLARPVMDAIVESHLARLIAPTAIGGDAADPVTLVRVIETVARADTSAGWCLAIGMGVNHLSGYYPYEAARALYRDLDRLGAGVFAPSGRAVPDGDGYRVTGRWSFASGCQHAAVQLGGVMVADANGTVTMPPTVKLAAMASTQVAVHETWDTAGMRGTGSHDVSARRRRRRARPAAELHRPAVGRRPHLPGAPLRHPRSLPGRGALGRRPRRARRRGGRCGARPRAPRRRAHPRVTRRRSCAPAGLRSGRGGTAGGTCAAARDAREPAPPGPRGPPPPALGGGVGGAGVHRDDGGRRAGHRHGRSPDRVGLGPAWCSARAGAAATPTPCATTRSSPSPALPSPGSWRASRPRPTRTSSASTADLTIRPGRPARHHRARRPTGPPGRGTGSARREPAPVGTSAPSRPGLIGAPRHRNPFEDPPLDDRATRSSVPRPFVRGYRQACQGRPGGGAEATSERQPVRFVQACGWLPSPS